MTVPIRKGIPVWSALMVLAVAVAATLPARAAPLSGAIFTTDLPVPSLTRTCNISLNVTCTRTAVHLRVRLEVQPDYRTARTTSR